MLPMISSNSSQSHLWLNGGWHKDVNSWVNHLRMENEITLQNIDIPLKILLNQNSMKYEYL